jgi:hypothetical protein
MKTLSHSLLAGAFLAFAATSASDAATVNLDLTIANGAFAGNAVTGSVTYDETFVPGTGSVSLSVGSGLLGLLLTLEGQVFDMTNDIDYPSWPRVDFEDGLMTLIDFLVSEVDLDNPTMIDALDVGSFSISSITDPGAGGAITGDVAINYSIAPVPLPAGLPLLVAGLGAFGLVARRRRKV